jgi:single-strand DNA-binding protein
MAGVNKVILIGNLTREPDYRQMPSGSAVTDFGMAMNRRFTNSRGEQQEDTCFVDIAAFGRTADVIRNYCHKGDPLFVEGRLRFDQWDDKASGAKRSRLTVVAESVELLSRRGNAPDGSQGGYPQGGYQASYQQGGYQQGYQQGGYQQGGYAQPIPSPVGIQPLTPNGASYAPQQPAQGGTVQFAPQPPPMPAFQPAQPQQNAAPANNDAPVEDVPF